MWPTTSNLGGLLFQNLFGLAAGPLIAGVLSDAFGLTPALTAVPAFGALAAAAFLTASRSYEADKAAVHLPAVGVATCSATPGSSQTRPTTARSY